MTTEELIKKLEEVADRLPRVPRKKGTKGDED